MKKTLVFILVIISFIILNNCTKDVLQTDITKKTVNLLAPGDGVHTPYNAVTFWWDSLADADKYELQIVTTSFTNILQLIADTSITKSKFTMTLKPGSYQWRVKAMNNTGSTVYSTRSFVIDSTSNLALITVGLNYPADSTYTNHLAQTFSWTAVPNATSYDFEIDNGSTPVTHTTITNTSLSYTFSQTASTNVTYTWKVRASNSFSNSAYTTRTLFLNLNPPITPTPLYPVQSGTVIPNFANKDSMLWSSIQPGSLDIDSLFVIVTTPSNPYDTTNASNMRLAVKCSKTYYKLQPADSSSTSSTRWFVRGANYNYYWKVNRSDQAGNSSPYSHLKKFVAN